MTSYKSEWEQIHAQIDAIIRAIPEHFLLDPPDGGDVTVAEGVQRMADEITRLRAALRGLIDIEDGPGMAVVGWTDAMDRARAALGGGDGH